MSEVEKRRDTDEANLTTIIQNLFCVFFFVWVFGVDFTNDTL